MKKLLLFILTVFTSGAFAQVTYTTPTPKYGCPNTTHDITIGATNNSGASLPSGTVVTVNVTVKDNTNTNTLGTLTQTFNDGFANGSTRYFTIPGVVFVGPMICNVTGSVSFTYIFAQNYPINTTYTVQYPPDLSISESPAGTIAVATPLDGYSVRYYLNSAVNYETTTTTYTPGVVGSYTAKGFDPVTSCISVNPSNAVVLSTVSGIQKGLAGVVNIYPNPASDIINVGLENSSATEAEMTLTDITGLKISTVNFKNQGGALNAEMPISQLAEGIYLLHIKSDAGVTCKKITKR